MKNISHWEDIKSTEEEALTMTQLSFIDDRSQTSLATGIWVNGNCFSTVDSMHDNECSINTLVQNKVSLDPIKDRILRIESVYSQRTRRVSFNSRVAVREIPSARTISQEERVDIWWTLNDYTLIRKMARITVQMMANGERIRSSDEDFCSRGLDHDSIKRPRRRKQMQRAISVVLRAQNFQREEGFNDPAYIAEVYGECCRPCREAAHEMGVADAKEIESRNF